MASTASRVNEDTVRKAVSALLKWRKLHLKKQLSKPPLPLDEEEEQEFLEEYDSNDDYLYLLLTLKKIPQKSISKTPYNIPLPNPLQKTLNLCLIIDDRPIKSPYKITLEFAQKKIKSEGIPISQVLKLSKLKSEYNSFEKRCNLYDSFDMFLADRRVVSVLPKLLGKQFYRKKRKVPVPLDLKGSGNWKEQVEEACGSSFLRLGTGTCSTLKIGRCGLSDEMGKDEIVENVFAAIEGVVEVVPKKWAGIRALHLKLSDSLALPIYKARLKVEVGGMQVGKNEKLEDEKVKKGKNGSNVDEDDDGQGDGSGDEKLEGGEMMRMKRKIEENRGTTE